MPRFRLPGIREKLLVAFSLLVTCMSVFIFVFFPARLEQQALAAVQTKAEAIADMTAYSLSAGVYFSDTKAVQEVLEGASRAPDIFALQVRDSLGHTVAARNRAGHVAELVARAHSHTTSPDDALYFVASPIVHERKQIGELTLGISLAGVHEDVARARQLGALVGALVFVVGFVVVWAISTLVTRPLMAVSRTVELIAGGNLSLRATEAPDAEVAQLVRAFNSMVDKLAGAQAELSATNAHLEERVDTRTAELREAIGNAHAARLALVQSEGQARATSEMLQSLIDVAPQAINAVDLDFTVTRWNRASEQLFGWSAAEVIGQRLPIVPEEHTAEFRSFQAMLESGQVILPREIVRKRKDGTIVSVLLAVSILRDAALAPLGYIAVITDLSDRKSLEEQLRQSQKMEAIGRLAGGVAHDFNNMLTVITSSAALLRETARHDEHGENLDAIATAAARASALTRQLLLFSRKQVVHLVPLNVNDVIADTSPMLRRLVRENIHYRTVLDETLGDVTADPTQMQQVIMNLVVNASDAMPDGGVLTMETRNAELDDDYAAGHAGVTPGAYVRLTISDTGIGMSEETVGKIFEPFFTTKPAGIGTGLGLATTYGVVAQLGGHLRVYSELGHGTVIKVFLPRCTHVRAATAAGGHITAPSAAVGGAATVLLVEDEASVRTAIRRTLARLGYEVIEAEDGESGLRHAAERAQVIDVVLTDLMMPGMNGRAFADQLRAVCPGLPVIFMSGYTDDTVNQFGLVDDTHAFLQKPFSGEQLSRTINSMLQGAAR